jgi:rod shape-determining protein MreD
LALWLSVPLLALLAAMQTSLVPSLDVGAARPQLVLVFVICWAVVRGEGEALPWAIVGGALLDLLSPLPPGSHIVALCLVAFTADLGHRFLHGQSLLFAAVAVALGSLVYGALLLGFAGDLPHRAVLLGLARRQILPGAAYNLVLTVPVLLLLRAWNRRFPRPVLPEF